MMFAVVLGEKRRPQGNVECRQVRPADGIVEIRQGVPCAARGSDVARELSRIWPVVLAESEGTHLWNDRPCC